MSQSKPCKFIFNGKSCPFGEKCRFLHQDLKKSPVLKHNEQREHSYQSKQQGSHFNKKLYSSDGELEEGRSRDKEKSRVLYGRLKRRHDIPEDRIRKINTPVCRFYRDSQCKYGDKCKYFHSGCSPGLLDVELDQKSDLSDRERHTSESAPVCDPERHTPESAPVCHFYLKNSWCKYGDKCRFTHSGQSIEKKEQKSLPRAREPVRIKREPTDSDKDHRYSDTRNPPPLTLASFMKARTHVKRPQKASQSQKEIDSSSLRDVEVEQLHARFPGESCSLLTKSQDKTTYLVHFQPSDQDWHGAPVLLLEVTIPASYPKDHCSVELSASQEMDPEVVACGNEAIQDYWNSDMLVGLMFRPFLRWWDNNLVAILQSPFAKSEELPGDISSDEENSDYSDEKDSLDEKTGQLQPLLKSKKGTEIRFVGLDLSQTLGTAYWTTIKVVLSCSRCKNHQEVEAKEEKLYSVVCGRCSSSMGVVYHLGLIHPTSSTLGYLELTGCAPVDVIFQTLSVTITCLDCNSEVISQGFFIGQPKDVYCRRCHTKITINASGIRYLQHQQSGDISGETVTVVQSSRKKLESVLKDGQPLPEYGICQHFKKSHRWLRFPCCGRAFPCDECHDATQDHPMERATRMICGYCSKEQGYSGKGECVRCGADLVSSKLSTHWEGGQGCRNKTKMSRLDKHKYKDSSTKTVCKKTERVGKK